MSAVINNATYGDDTIYGKVNASMNGTVTIQVVPGSTKPINVTVNESGEFTIPLKLPAGTYSNVAVTFLSADGNYRGSTRVNLTINKLDPQVTVDIGSEDSFDIKFGDTVVAIVGVPDDATGVVYFSLDNETWIPVTIPKKGSLVEYDIPDLDVGNYILFVKYSGDKNYNSVYSENPFTVDQLKTTVTVDPVKGKAGEKVNITVRVTDERGNPVEEGTVKWKTIISNFYPDLDEAVNMAEKELENVEIQDEMSGEMCEECGKPLYIKYGPHGKFQACSGFPDCHFTKPYYEKIDVACPKCGKDIVIRASRKGRKYFGCIDNPACDFMTWQRPTGKLCPKCNSMLLLRGAKRVCMSETCNYSEDNK